MPEKTHYRKAFKSPYLSSADIVGPTNLTIKEVRLEADKSKKTKDMLNTAYFVEKEIRQGEPLKPMVLNVQNCKTLKGFAGSAFIDDWKNIYVTVYVDQNVRFGRDIVEGLRISPEQPRKEKRQLTPEMKQVWDRAVNNYKKTKSLVEIKEHFKLSEEHQDLLIEQGGHV